MRFKNRSEAGKKLADLLLQYKNKDVVVYALPRGGVVTAKEIAKKLNAPLDLLITRKIGHPNQAEYALSAVTENGNVVGDKKQIASIDKYWFAREVEKEKQEAKRRRSLYLANQKSISVKGKTAIIVDDGIATGLTIKAAIADCKKRKPAKIVIAVPIAPYQTAKELKTQADEVIALETPGEFYAIGGYYNEFPQVSDEEVIKIMYNYSIQ